jgi:hypothetical protein
MIFRRVGISSDRAELLRDVEGECGHFYFGLLNDLIRVAVATFVFRGRSPPARPQLPQLVSGSIRRSAVCSAIGPEGPKPRARSDGGIAAVLANRLSFAPLPMLNRWQGFHEARDWRGVVDRRRRKMARRMSCAHGATRMSLYAASAPGFAHGPDLFSICGIGYER